MNKTSIGRRYETAASQYLMSQGFRILESNYRCRCGEIDLIAEEDTEFGTYTVFVEVKYRTDVRAGGGPLWAVDRAKQRRILRTAELWLKQQPRGFYKPCRFDVIAVFPKGIRHFRNAFYLNGGV